jgi:hypothetical protein
MGLFHISLDLIYRCKNQGLKLKECFFFPLSFMDLILSLLLF